MTAITLDGLNLAYHERRGWKAVYWQGVRAVKCPLDLWVMQEIICEQRPDFIIETGTHSGGSALFFASICDLLGHGEVLSIDLQAAKPNYPEHDRITYLDGLSSIDPEVAGLVQRMVAGGSVFVDLDSDHSRAHVEAELDAYAPLVQPGGYVVVEDTNFGLVWPDRPELLPGPAEAVAAWLERSPEWEADRSREKHGVTFNPGGYLRRK